MLHRQLAAGTLGQVADHDAWSVASTVRGPLRGVYASMMYVCVYVRVWARAGRATRPRSAAHASRVRRARYFYYL